MTDNTTARCSVSKRSGLCVLLRYAACSVKRPLHVFNPIAPKRNHPPPRRSRPMSRTRTQIGAVIAERSLQRRDSPRRTVVVSLGKPRRTKGTQDWECPFQIRGSGMRRVEYGRGIDAFQALTMALEGIRYFLDRSRMPLAWTGVRDDTGFQRLIPLLPEPGVSADGAPGRSRDAASLEATKAAA